MRRVNQLNKQISYLSDSHADKWNNFADYLRYYNLLDTRPLAEALSICFEKFKEFFHVDPGDKAFVCNHNKYCSRYKAQSSWNSVHGEI